MPRKKKEAVASGGDEQLVLHVVGICNKCHYPGTGYPKSGDDVSAEVHCTNCGHDYIAHKGRVARDVLERTKRALREMEQR